MRAPFNVFAGLRGLSLSLLLGIGLIGCGQGEGSGGANQGPPPPPVTVAEVTAQNVQVTGEYAGRARGSRQVEVRARVGGTLEERLYSEGQFLEAGDPLFRIERQPYEIAVKRAEAELANARASLNQADREWRRISSLFERNAISERERDQALSQRELAQAQFALAEASLAQAQLDLSYTIVRAPVAGPTGLESLPEGSLIDRGTLLTTVTQHNPIHVHFALPPSDAATQRMVRAAMAGQGDVQQVEATLLFSDGSTYGEKGIVNFTDSTIDPRTGNVSARAVFANDNNELTPGQFVRIRMPIQQLENVFLVEEQVVGQGRQGPRVFILTEEGTVREQPVEVGPVVDGKRVILSGLENGDKLVVNGHVALRDGAPVTPTVRNGRED
ncbi:efflux transporter periplasmic adaptor subunit [Alkalilimnicola ehrlichii]|uniref:Efflux transporter periplasmic adaptor subunit n=1 Tax=Alkalilimnicola ehrlichii TaxID=351052 RepID=A0A3E0X2P0_9GAMM|nr:efflux RND transporter periplasmic adaptor subunit [Alkalilimnicola ehrlichii]RFA28986.1 efflux transporter periplasmic adaptor subunit [Alkalilimnicola ehrlichii]RFA38622.1 efflux transporter periplasmic adaptor subunit [Alkalilimnicola ehrlichii]